MKKKQVVSIIVFIIGLITLLVGVIFLVLGLNKGAPIQDGDYLVSVNSWVKEDEPSVIWDFSEIGKGKLTTNDYKNVYDFIWAIEGDTLKIETDWLYTLNDEYKYRIENGDLVLTEEDSTEIRFRPTEVEFGPTGSVNPEVSEDD